eukprot:m.156177 g.156177  ORF g.156177 m.156177 type:complete len:51 (+) comp16291_c0_seq1:55-207(+)
MQTSVYKKQTVKSYQEVADRKWRLTYSTLCEFQYKEKPFNPILDRHTGLG